ncbi:MAG: winged helix-turn-helix domain-containing protein [Anaerolineae bacterium]|nr:winged helix-turn-helix domain-containing protein [Anaerolineae bacterium]
MARIVLISDDLELSREVTQRLEGKSHVVIPLESQESHFYQAAQLRPDLLVVDFASMSREVSAAFQRALAALDLKCPVLGIFGALDVVRSLPALVGTADALAAKQANRKTKPAGGEYGFMSLDVHRREVTIRGVSIPLTPTETHILSILAANAGKYLSPQAIASEIQGYEVDEREASELVRVHIHNLRRKFQKAGVGPPYIVSSRGKGYLLERRTRPHAMR